MYWSSDLKNSKRCPVCNSILENEYKSYLLAIETKKNAEPFIVGNDAGSFCSNCPVVVLDADKFSEMVSGAQDVRGGLTFLRRGAPKLRFFVLGIVDLDAVPEDKKSEPFDDDNPIPIVEFTNLSSKKIGRNQPCPCGSGKKYKRCCGK